MAKKKPDPIPPAASAAPGGREDVAREIEATLDVITRMAASTDPLTSTLTPQQIDRLFDLLERREERQSSERNLSLGCLTGTVVIIVVAVCFFWGSAVFSNHPELASDILKTVAGVLGGLLGGYGLHDVTKRVRTKK